MHMPDRRGTPDARCAKFTWRYPGAEVDGECSGDDGDTAAGSSRSRVGTHEHHSRRRHWHGYATLTGYSDLSNQIEPANCRRARRRSRRCPARSPVGTNKPCCRWRCREASTSCSCPDRINHLDSASGRSQFAPGGRCAICSDCSGAQCDAEDGANAGSHSTHCHNANEQPGPRAAGKAIMICHPSAPDLPAQHIVRPAAKPRSRAP